MSIFDIDNNDGDGGGGGDDDIGDADDNPSKNFLRASILIGIGFVSTDIADDISRTVTRSIQTPDVDGCPIFVCK